MCIDKDDIEKEVKSMAAVKPLEPTIVRDIDIIMEIVKEVERKPTAKAIENNVKALDF